MKRKRTNYSAQEKIEILKKHLLGKIPISDLCDQYKLQPTVFYRWQKQFFEQGEMVFGNGKRDKKSQEDGRKVAALEQKIQVKNEVLSELMEEHVKLKKSLGVI